ncbi:MAG: hypothetical protein SFT90_06530 [Rickettsiales bacterium]|nr:hypothetical protein [Rickettsiales bacterium]
MENTKIIYKGFAEDNTKAGKIRAAQIEALLCIFEESISKCRSENLNEVKMKTSEFKQLTKLTKLPNYDILIEKKDIAKSVLWIGTFKTKKRKFMVCAEQRDS